MRHIYLIFIVCIFSCNQKQKSSPKLVNENINKTEADDQIDKLNKAILSDPSNAKLYGNRATYYTAIKEYEKAEQDFQKSIEINPNDPIIWDNYGTLKSRRNDFKKAFKAYSTAVELSPSNSQFINNAGWSLLNISEFEESIKYFDKAIRIDSTFNQAYLNKGLALIGLQQNKQGCMLLHALVNRGFSDAQTYIDNYCR